MSSDPRGDREVTKESVAPPPGHALLAAVSVMKRVRTRKPLQAFFAVGAFATAVTVLALGLRPWRKDLLFLPPAWVLLAAGAWALGASFPLWRAIVPRRGSVLPDTGAAGMRAVLAAVGLLLFGLLATVDAPGHTVIPPATVVGFFRYGGPCLIFGLEMVTLMLVAGAIPLRRTIPVGAARVAAAIGASGGALGGFLLHFICGLGGALHVGVAHGGSVAVGAMLGVLIASRFLRTRA